MTWVLELIDEKKCYWKEDAIKAVLPMHETEIICMIPLCDTRPEDQLIWHYNKDRKFSVKLAYWMIMDLLKHWNGKVESSSQKEDKML